MIGDFFWPLVGVGVACIIAVAGTAYLMANPTQVKKAVAGTARNTKKNVVFDWQPVPANIEIWLKIEEVYHRALAFRFTKDEKAGAVIEYRYRFAGSFWRSVKLKKGRWFIEKDKRTLYGIRINIVVLSDKHMNVADYTIQKLEDDVALRDEMLEGAAEERQKLPMSVAALKVREKYEERIAEHSTIDGFGPNTLDDTGAAAAAQQQGT